MTVLQDPLLIREDWASQLGGLTRDNSLASLTATVLPLSQRIGEEIDWAPRRLMQAELGRGTTSKGPLLTLFRDPY